MALEALSSSELLNFIIYDTLSATPFSCNDNSSETTTSSAFFLDNINKNELLKKPPQPQLLDINNISNAGAAAAALLDTSRSMPMRRNKIEASPEKHHQTNLAVVQGGRKKRRRRPKVCKNKEEAETQRMTHIAVERNRRKQMNEHLAVLRSLMPDSYVQRGDQASIVGGAIEYVKELEHMLQSLEAQRFLLLQQQQGPSNDNTAATTSSTSTGTGTGSPKLMMGASATPFGQFFSYPQYTWSQCSPNNNSSKMNPTRSKAAIADIEVTLIETHANVRILSRRRGRQLPKMVSAFHQLYLTILHLNVTTLDPFVLYSISAKVEEGCQLSSAEDIAGAVHHVIRIIEEEAMATLCC